MDKNNFIQFLLWIDSDLKHELEEEADNLGMSLSAYIRLLLKHRRRISFYDNNNEK